MREITAVITLELIIRKINSIAIKITKYAIKNDIVAIMARPFTNHEQMSLACKLYCRGHQQKEIQRRLSKDCVLPSLRTLNYRIKRFKSFNPRDIELEKPLQWNRLEFYGIP